MHEQNFDMKQFLADRKAAFLSMDKETILQYALRYDIRPLVAAAQDPVSQRENFFWVSVHMARTGAKDFPMEERVKSKKWLAERGYRSMDDGDVKI